MQVCWHTLIVLDCSLILTLADRFDCKLCDHLDKDRPDSNVFRHRSLCFFATQAMCTFNWSRASDRIGRKPIILCGLGGLCLSMTLFGLSKTFWGLVFRWVRIHATKNSVMLDSLWSSRRPCRIIEWKYGSNKRHDGRAYWFYEHGSSICVHWDRVVCWRDDSVSWQPREVYVKFTQWWHFRSLVGGNLSRPYDRFPNVFGNEFLEKLSLSPSVPLFGVLHGLCFPGRIILPERGMRSSHRQLHLYSNSNRLSTNHKIDSTATGTTVDGPLPLRSLMTRPILLSVANYCMCRSQTVAYGLSCHCSTRPQSS